jgi:hypothetical protein
LLFAEGVYSESELEKIEAGADTDQHRTSSGRSINSQKSIEMAEKRQLLQDYRIRRVEKERSIIRF